MEENKVSSPNWMPEVLVLGPGGMKGFLEIGSLLYIEKSGLLDNVHTYIGTSVGSLISLLKVCGYTSEEMLKEAITVSIFDFVNIDLTGVRDNMGLADSNPMRIKLEHLVRRKFGLVPTLEQLYMTTGKILTAVTYNLTQNRTEYINRDNRPNMSCVEAVMLSCNIPGLFWKASMDNDTYIDGALGNPYPVDIYDDGKTDILGIYISSVMNKSTSPMWYFWKIAQCSMNEISNRIRKSCSDRCKHIVLESPTIDTTGVSFTKETKAKLIIDGWEKAKEFMVDLYPKRLDIAMGNIMRDITDDKGNIFYEEVEDEEIVEPILSNDRIIIPVTPRVRDILRNTGGLYLIRLGEQSSGKLIKDKT